MTIVPNTVTFGANQISLGKGHGPAVAGDGSECGFKAEAGRPALSEKPRWSAGRRSAPEAGGSRKRIVLWRAPRPKRERVATFARVARPTTLAPPGAASRFPSGRSFVKACSKARTRSRAARTRLLVTSPRARGEKLRSSEQKRARVRGPLRDSERRGPGDSAPDAAARLRPAERPPHPNPLPARGERERGRTARTFLGVAV